MFIRNCLTEKRNLLIVNPSETITDVLVKMDGHLSLPCVGDDDEFLGMISKRTIFEAFQTANDDGQTYESFLQTSADKCIDKSVASLTLDSLFEETIVIITRQPFIPIVEDGKLLGIVKRSDIQQALSIVFATNVESDRILLGAAEVEGALERLFNITHKLNLNVTTCVPFDAGDNQLNRRIILKVSKSDRLDALVTQLSRAGFLIISVN